VAAMMNEDSSPVSADAALMAVEDVTGRRIVAALIDIVVLVVVFVLFAMLFGDSGTEGEETKGVNLSLSGGPAIVYFVVVIAYYFVLEAATGKTLGKMAMGLRVVAIDGAYTPAKAFIRNLLRIVDGLPFLYLLGLIVIASSKRKQRIGDMAAGTRVVRTNGSSEPDIRFSVTGR
jgi:uncharacterized RDD family membrane protein YckC